jgi:hypothetical protein
MAPPIIRGLRIALAGVLVSLTTAAESQALVVTESRTDRWVFEGAGCGSEDVGRTVIPGGATKARAAMPREGEVLRDRRTRERVVKVINTRRGRLDNGTKVVFWRVKGVNDVCNRPFDYPQGWSTRQIRLKAKFRIEVDVRFVDGAGRNVREPSNIYFGASQQINDLRPWNGWDSRTARAVGSRPINDCDPSCGEGQVRRYRVAVTLYDVDRCGNRYQYTKLHQKYLSGPWAGRSETLNFGYQC